MSLPLPSPPSPTSTLSPFLFPSTSSPRPSHSQLPSPRHHHILHFPRSTTPSPPFQEWEHREGVVLGAPRLPGCCTELPTRVATTATATTPVRLYSTPNTFPTRRIPFGHYLLLDVFNSTILGWEHNDTPYLTPIIIVTLFHITTLLHKHYIRPNVLPCTLSQPITLSPHSSHPASNARFIHPSALHPQHIVHVHPQSKPHISGSTHSRCPALSPALPSPVVPRKGGRERRVVHGLQVRVLPSLFWYMCFTRN